MKRRPSWLWAFVLWMSVLAIISMWRGATFWRYRSLFDELKSTVSSAMAVAFALMFALYGVGLLTSAVGLLWWHRWARRLARVSLLLYLTTVQVYNWGFVRTGLLWERRWLSLAMSLVALAVGAVVLCSSKLDKIHSSEDNYGF